MVEVWREVARNEQQMLLEVFGTVDWDVYLHRDRRKLEDKVGMVIFGPPDGDDYSRRKRDHIRMVTNTIVREESHRGEGGQTWMAIVVVVVQPPDAEYYCHPVFRVPTTKKHVHTFVDCLGRVYDGFRHFLIHNKLPKSDLCYPLNGVYSRDAEGEVRLGFAKAGGPLALFEVADGASNVVATTTLLVAGVALATPVAAPVVAGAAVAGAVCGIYNSARALFDQFDRAVHKQNTGLGDTDSVRNWLTIGCGLVGMRSAMKLCRVQGIATKAMAMRLAAVSTVRPSAAEGVPEEMLRDARGKAMPLRHVSRYALLFGHVVLGAAYAADRFPAATDNCLLEERSLFLEETEDGVKLRYLEYRGVD